MENINVTKFQRILQANNVLDRYCSDEAVQKAYNEIAEMLRLDMNKVEKIYNEFWKPIIEENGTVNLKQVKKELYDFYMVINEVSKVYCIITGSQVSKPLTSADTVIALADEYYDTIYQDLGE